MIEQLENIKNIHLTIAGAGAGKTYDMVLKVKKHLPTLKPYKTLAVITYTNAATDEIRNRLRNQIEITPNIFIGTIHSFLIQFIFEPFAKLLGVSSGKNFYADEVFMPEPWFIEKHEEYCNYAQELYQQGFDKYGVWRLLKKRWKEKNAEKITANRIFVHDKVLEKALLILQNPKVAELVANRLQYVFVDEYQDARVLQHEALLRIHSFGKTKFFFVGDPLQSIYKFGYELSHNTNDIEKCPEKFNEIPIMQLMQMFENKGKSIDHLPYNHRSSKKIREFVNCFQLNKYRQKPTTNLNESEPEGFDIFFIDNTDKIYSIRRFIQLIDELNIPNESSTDKRVMHKLIISRKNSTVPDIQDKLDFDCVSLDNQNIKQRSYFKEFHVLILNIIGYSEYELVKQGVSKLEQRKLTIKTIEYFNELANNESKAITDLLKEYPSSIELQKKIKEFWNKQAGIEIRDFAQTEITNSLFRLLDYKSDDKNSDTVFYSTVHKAKGLEATCVLTIADNNYYHDDLLHEWFKQSKTEFDDEVRVGYVAFSRPRKLLCIASEKPLKQEIRKRMQELNIKIIK